MDRDPLLKRHRRQKDSGESPLFTRANSWLYLAVGLGTLSYEAIGDLGEELFAQASLDQCTPLIQTCQKARIGLPDRLIKDPVLNISGLSYPIKAFKEGHSKPLLDDLNTLTYKGNERVLSKAVMRGDIVFLPGDVGIARAQRMREFASRVSTGPDFFILVDH